MPKQAIGPNQRKWLDALRSGEYRQTQGSLASVVGVNAFEFCCLGVGYEVAGISKEVLSYGEVKYDGDKAIATTRLRDFLALRDQCGGFADGVLMLGHDSLTEANDSGATFAEIADFCEAHPEAVFTETR